ncbi:MAG: hypothetical protein ACOYI4_06945, partial [Christensenellales bacterium]|jgi:glutaredoxin 2
LENSICDIHTEEWASNQEVLHQLIADSKAYISRVQSNMDKYADQLTQEQILALDNSIQHLESLLNETDATIERIQKAKQDLEQLSNRFLNGTNGNR